MNLHILYLPSELIIPNFPFIPALSSALTLPLPFTQFDFLDRSRIPLSDLLLTDILDCIHRENFQLFMANLRNRSNSVRLFDDVCFL